MQNMLHTIPLYMEVTPHLAAPAALIETRTHITWHLQQGANTNTTATHSLDLMSDEVLAAALLLCDRGHIPIHTARTDPQATLGPLANRIVTPDLIPLMLGERPART